MAAIDRKALLQRTMPVALRAMGDDPGDMATRGAGIIMDIGSQAERRTATTLAMQGFRTAATLGANAESGAVTKLAVGAITKIGARGAARYGVLGIPVAGEAIGGAMLAYDVWKLGYKATIGTDFETTSVGQGVTRAANGTWRAGLGVAGGMMSALGMNKAAELTRGWVSETLTGSRAYWSGPGDETASAAAAAAPEKGSSGPSTPRATSTPEVVGSTPPSEARKPDIVKLGTPGQNNTGRTATGEPATIHSTAGAMLTFRSWDTDKPQDKAAESTPSPTISPASTPTPKTTTLTQGPPVAMGQSDWKETPYVARGGSATMATTPLGRAFATMDMLVADVGLPTANGPLAPAISADAPARTRMQAKTTDTAVGL